METRNFGDMVEETIQWEQARVARFRPPTESEADRTHFNPETDEIWVFTGDPGDYYEVPVARLKNAVVLADFLLQISTKDWPNRESALEFMECLDYVCNQRFRENCQGVFCPHERPMLVDWETQTFAPGRIVPAEETD